MRAVWLALFACAACKESKKEEARPRPLPDDEPPVAREAEPPAPKTGGGLPEKGPHPDYPTAAAAGTDKIFFLEEPDRGPKPPSTYAIPKDLTWTRAPSCEIYEKTFACGAGSGEWHIGKKPGVTVVDERRGAQVDDRTVYLHGADGAITQRLSVDREGRVTDALLFSQPGRYTGRTRSGGNALDGCGMYAYVEDKQGRVIETKCLQWLGEPMRDTSGVVITKYVLDERGFNREWTHHGIDGAPIDDTDGVHRTVVTRDAAGRVTLRQRFGASGARVVSSTGCAGAKLEYNANGRLARRTCLDIADAATGDPDGIAQTTYRYDAAGCEVARRAFDAKGGRAKSTHGVHGRDYTVDERCHTLSETCLDVREKPRACSPGVAARTVYERDARGFVTSSKYFDETGAPSGDSGYHVHELRYAYDDAGNATEMRCFDESAQAVECSKTGFHGWREVFDDAGRLVSQRFLTTSGGVATNMGVFERTFRYDNYDHVVEQRSLDRDGKLMDVHGMATRRHLWDATHRLFAVQLFGLDDKPARYRACYTGATCPPTPWHAVRINRRADGTVLTNQFFDADGQLLTTVDCLEKPCFEDA
ncbi:MAG: hypothetical protein JNL83_32840 [Myxococcales bacterium]|nr:hypothetical protein [Myxococcales bacterium]